MSAAPKRMTAGVRFEDELPRLSGKVLSCAEQLLVPSGARLPSDYRKFLLQHNGAAPNPAYFHWEHPKGGAVSSWVVSFLGIDSTSLFGVHRPDLVSQLLRHRQEVPMSFLPIGYAVRDDLLLIGLDEWDSTHGQIWIKYMDEVDARVGGSTPDDALYFVAPNFSAFLSMLHADPAADQSHRR